MSTFLSRRTFLGVLGVLGCEGPQQAFAAEPEFDCPGNWVALEHVANAISRGHRQYHPDWRSRDDFGCIKLDAPGDIVWGFCGSGRCMHPELMRLLASKTAVRFSDDGLAWAFASGPVRYGDDGLAWVAWDD